MSSYISVGFVTNDEKSFIKKCNDVININSEYIKKITINYPVDDSCNIWRDLIKKVEDIEAILNKCFSNTLAEIVIDYKNRNQEVKGVLVKIKREMNKYTGR